MKFLSILILSSLVGHFSAAATLMTSRQVDRCIENKKRVQYLLKCLYQPDKPACVSDYSSFYSRYNSPIAPKKRQYQLDRRIAKKYADSSGIAKTITVALPLWALSWVAELTGGGLLASGIFKTIKGRIKMGLKDIGKGAPKGIIGWTLFYFGGKGLFNSGRLIGKCHNKKSIQWIDQFLEKYVANPSIKLLRRVGFSHDDYKAVADGKPLLHKDIRKCVNAAMPPKFAKKIIDTAMTGDKKFESDLHHLVGVGTPSKKMMARTILCDLLDSTATDFSNSLKKIKCIGNSKLIIGNSTFEIRDKIKLMQIRVHDGNAIFEKVYGKRLGRQTVNLNTGRITYETLDGRRPSMWDRRAPYSVSMVLSTKAAILRCL